MPKTNTQLSEQRTAAASYILSFYQSVQTLTATYANYSNMVELLANTYGEEGLKNLSDEHRNALMGLVQQIKYYIKHTYVQWSSILHGTTKDDDEPENTLEELYDKLKGGKNYVIDVEDVEQYVLQANKVLTKDIIRDLMENSQEIIDSIYSATE